MEPLACLSPDALSVTVGISSKSYMLWSWEVREGNQVQRVLCHLQTDLQAVHAAETRSSALSLPLHFYLKHLCKYEMNHTKELQTNPA